MSLSPSPVVAVPACRKFIAPHPFHVVGDKYLRALTDAAGALPLVVPALGERIALPRLLGRIDGLMLTGSPSNVDPARYNGPAARADTELDVDRDATTLGLINAAVAAGIPVLAICRGFQEVNVALGGSLHQHVHELDGMLDHRENKTLSREQQYAPAHSLQLRSGGLLHQLAGGESVRVNSLHAQGVNRLANGLRVEALAPDGLIEAFSLDNDAQWLLGVQWHPEWQVMNDDFYRAIFNRFGDACRRYAAQEHHETDSRLA